MYILFDIGGTKMRLSASKDGERLSEPLITDTPHNFEEGMRVFAEEVARLSGGEKIEGAAGAISGTWNSDKSTLLFSPHLQDWEEKPIVERLKKVVAAPVYCDNDGAIVGLGEALQGAGKGKQIVGYITVSTGVGGSRIVKGKIDKKMHSLEPGHQILELKDGKTFSLEDMVSGTSLEKKTGQKAYDIPQDDPVWEELSRNLAHGLHNTLVHWAPDVIVLGGSMIVGDPAIPLDRIKFHVEAFSTTGTLMCELKKAELKDVGGLYGALAYLKEEL